ncbi:NHLP family bacteriocin export ABC transporter peptidase/permease/ATPase [Planotetraspora thailandica]|uniref:NHLP family bacteriocin export ABC transporter peptidase/permease/ATPase n=1 Tax=Planotetraspora thailandica TaxID=487172 RepID=A0A8J3V4H4_9ACTN|nr:peptidase domain-containing ABC transporter [Planotetraspora thailandica]GII55392.1 NHLP family bacteriocin export ABC transporter peptidase/permease/ATPase [Planotetraspora thailandica]
MRHRVPVRLQMTRTECGAACLAMVLSHHGRDTSVSECRDLLEPGRDGVSPESLVAAAGKLGMRATAERVEDLLARPLTRPVIAYWSKHHYVVLERATGSKVRVADPARGRRTLTREEFSDEYGGVVVDAEPGEDFVRRRTPWRQRILVRYLREFVGVRGGRRILLSILLLAAGLQILGLSLPLATKFAVDYLVPDGRHDLLWILGAGVLGIVVLQGALSLFRARLLLALRAKADRRLIGRFVTHLLRLPLGFFLQRSRGDLLMRLSSVSAGREAVTQQVLTLSLDGVLLIGYVTALTLISPWYTVIVAVLGAMQIGLMLSSYNRVRVLSQQELTTRAEEQSYLIEALQAILPVKANGVEEQARRRWSTLFDTYQTAMVRRGKATSWFEGGQAALSVLAPLALLWCGVWLVLGGRMTLGSMLAANTLAMSVLSPLMGFVGVIQLLSMLRGQIERIYDVLDSAAELSGDRTLPDRRPVSVQARDVVFRYAPESAPVVSGVSFTVAPGAKLGVVGRTGSGKSTLALLVLGLLRGEAGEIRHDGVLVDDLDLGDLRRGCGAVLQELSLFNGTIRDNITLGSPDATDADVVEAATLAGLHQDVLRLPMGYKTTVGEGGASLSAGQRQRVALARALVHKPRLLILDEATSHLDPETERRVDTALSALRVTRIVISHRLSAIRNADEIVVVREGQVVERGRHEDLLDRLGDYHSLFGDAAFTPAAQPALP